MPVISSYSAKLKTINIREEKDCIEFFLNDIRIELPNKYAFQIYVCDQNEENILLGYAFNILWINIKENKIILKKEYDFAVTKILVLELYLIVISEYSIHKIHKITGVELNEVILNDVIISTYRISKDYLNLVLFSGERYTIQFNNFQLKQLK